MSIKRILVPLLSQEQASAALAAAFAIAKPFRAHVQGLHIRPDPAQSVPSVIPTMLTDYIVETTDAISRAAAELAGGLKGQLEEEAGRNDVPMAETDSDGPSASWREAQGFIPDDFALAARVFDLVVLRRPPKSAFQTERDLVTSVLLESGRPVLLVPEGGVESLDGTVLVGWNGSVEAAQALAVGLPFLARSRAAKVVTIGAPPARGPDAGDAAALLFRHGVEVETVSIPEPKKDAGSVLLQAAHQAKASLLIVGAYSRSRWRELVLGGVTRHVIEHADLPVLLVH